MATTFVDYTGDGNATKQFTFPSIQESDIKVKVDEVVKSSGTHYNITGYTTTGGGNVVFTSGNIPTSPSVIHIYRDTNVDSAKATYQAGASVKAGDLNANHEQVLFALQEEQNQLERIGDIKDGSIDSAKIKDDTIVNADVNSAAAIAGTKISPDFGSQNIATTGTVDGRDVSADGTKLDGIESGATADQTAAEIRTLVGNATDSNVFTDADHSKLDGIEAGATADQTNAEIRAAVEAATDSNVFTDADHTKLNNIETGATADQTGAEIKAAYEGEANTNAFTDAEKTKLGNLGSLNALSDVNTSGVADGKILKYDASTSEFIIADDGGGGSGGGSSTFTGLSDTPANFGGAAGKTLKVNSAGNAVEFVTVTVPAGNFAGLTDTPANFSGGAGKVVKVNSNADGLEFAATGIVSADTDPELSSGLDVKTYEINTSTTNGNVKLSPNGTGAIEIKGAGGNDGTLQLNCSQNSHGVKIKSPAHSAGASYTLTLPPDDGDANEVLKTDGSGNLDWTTIATDKIEEGNSKAEIIDVGTGDFKVTLDNNQALSITPTITNLGSVSTPNHLYTYGDIRFSVGSGTSPYLRLDSYGKLEVTGAYGGGSYIGSVWKFGGYNGSHISHGNINPSADSTYSLGTNTTRWANGYFDTLYGDGSNLTNLPASSYNIQINTLSSSSGSGGGSATFNGSATRFTLSNAGTNAQAHIVSVNGVIQKPNSGTSPSEGFAIDGNDIIFASAPASGSDFFILTLGNAINLSVPADDSVTSNKIVSGAVSGDKIAQGGVTNSQILDDTISESKLDIHAAPSGTDKVLGYTANGMEWVESAAGATGGGTDKIFWENGQTVTTNYTITNGYNAMSAGPVTINNGVAVTIGTGENWTIV